MAAAIGLRDDYDAAGLWTAGTGKAIAEGRAGAAGSSLAQYERTNPARLARCGRASACGCYSSSAANSFLTVAKSSS